MKKYVVDASLILKSLLGEDSGVAKKFAGLLKKVKVGEVEIFSHHLIVLEVANGLRFTLKDKDLALEIFETFLQLPFKIISLSNTQQVKTLGLSYDLGTTTYDTSYHVLAKSRGAVFVTSDGDYYKKAKQLNGVELWGG